MKDGIKCQFCAKYPKGEVFHPIFYDDKQEKKYMWTCFKCLETTVMCFEKVDWTLIGIAKVDIPLRRPELKDFLVGDCNTAVVMRTMVGRPNPNHQGIVVVDDLDSLMPGRAFIKTVLGVKED